MCLTGNVINNEIFTDKGDRLVIGSKEYNGRIYNGLGQEVDYCDYGEKPHYNDATC